MRRSKPRRCTRWAAAWRCDARRWSGWGRSTIACSTTTTTSTTARACGVRATRVAVAADAWIDHGCGRRRRLGAQATARASATVCAWCSSTPAASSLAAWATWEAARLVRRRSRPVRVQKLRSIAWNMRHLPSALRSRRRMRGQPSAPERAAGRLVGGRLSGRRPAAPAARRRSGPGRSRDGRTARRGQLLYGWFPAERVDGRGYRWAATSAAALVHLDRPATSAASGVRARAGRHRRGRGAASGGSAQPEPLGERLAHTPCLAVHRDARWRTIQSSCRRETTKSASPQPTVGLIRRVRRARSAFALSSLCVRELLEITPGGSTWAPPSGRQAVGIRLVRTPNKMEQRHFRWATGRAALSVRSRQRASARPLSYRCPLRLPAGCAIALRAGGAPQASGRRQLAWRPGEWRKESLPLELDAGRLRVFELRRGNMVEP